MTKKKPASLAVTAIVIVAILTVLIAVKGRHLHKVRQQQKPPDWNSTQSHETAWPGEVTPSSQATVSSDGQLKAGSHATLTITYTAGRRGLNKFGAIRAAFEHGANWGRLQTVAPKEENYVTAQGPPGVELKAITDPQIGLCELAEAQVVSGKVRRGQVVRLIIGDRSGGSKGLLAPAISESPGAGRVRIFEDRTGEGQFYAMPDVPEMNILPGPPHHLKVIARSWAAVGAPVNAVLQVQDKFNNLAAGLDKIITIVGLESGKNILSAEMKASDGGFLRIQGLTCPKAGIFRFRVQEAGGALSAVSNPIECLADAGAPRYYFGSIHSHTMLSDGLNTIEGATLYARDVSNVDFFASTDHAILPDDSYDHVLLRHNIYEDQWKAAADAARKFNDPGHFVTFLAFEWSTKTYGDKNIYFLDDRAPYRRFPSTPEELYKSLEHDRVLVITHTMMGVTGERGPNWDHVDNRVEKVMEIVSGHGLREYTGNYSPICKHDKELPLASIRGNLAAEVLKRGLRLGFVGGSDDHTGKPGSALKGVNACPVAGFAGIRASTLSRDTIFNSIQNRAVYATSGARILLSFSINGHNMGEEMRIGNNVRRAITVEAHGEAPIKEVDVIRENPYDPLKAWKWDAPVYDPGTLQWTDDAPLTASTWYYVRVIQSDNHLAWSSPIWVDLH